MVGIDPAITTVSPAAAEKREEEQAVLREYSRSFHRTLQLLSPWPHLAAQEAGQCSLHSRSPSPPVRIRGWIVVLVVEKGSGDSTDCRSHVSGAPRSLGVHTWATSCLLLCPLGLAPASSSPLESGAGECPSAFSVLPSLLVAASVSLF